MPAFMQRLDVGDVEHGSSRTERWIRAHWIALAGGIALAEGILVVIGSLSKTIALIVAAGVIVAYFTVNKSSFSSLARISARVAALSQALVLFVPLLLFLFQALAIAVLVIIAVVVFSALLRGRD